MRTRSRLLTNRLRLLLALLLVSSVVIVSAPGAGKSAGPAAVVPSPDAAETSAAKNKFERDLFLIARPQGAGMRADFAKFQAYQPPPEEFLSNIDFVDQLDLDGDGMGEVFATQAGFDAYAYLIFKKVGGRWRQVYQGLGDAC